jgi:hypothetical protein
VQRSGGRLRDDRLDDVRLVAAIGTGLLEPPDTGTEFWWDEPPRQPAAWPARCAS